LHRQDKAIHDKGPP